MDPGHTLPTGGSGSPADHGQGGTVAPKSRILHDNSLSPSHQRHRDRPCCESQRPRRQPSHRSKSDPVAQRVRRPGSSTRKRTKSRQDFAAGGNLAGNRRIGSPPDERNEQPACRHHHECPRPIVVPCHEAEAGCNVAALPPAAGVLE